MERNDTTSSMAYWKLLAVFIEYRMKMPVTKLMVFKTRQGETGYYVCPRCNVTLPREFVAYCDRCGQCLDWKGYKKVEIVRLGR